MEFLKNWITPLVKQALYQALESPDSCPNPHELGDSFDDDGSNFRVRSRCSKHAQLLNWAENPTPLEGTFSDSHSLIRGIVSNDARLAYRKKHREDITKNTMGGVVLIKEFEIVMSQVPTRQPEITLFIQKIILLGCEGSGVFGHPQDITTDKAICELAKRCWGNNRQYEPDPSDNEESVGGSSQPSQIPPSRNLRVDNDGTLPTQLGLSSQAPPPNNAAEKPKGAKEPMQTSRSGFDSKQLLGMLKQKSAGGPPVTKEKATSTPRVSVGIPNGHNHMNYEHPQRAKTPPKVSQLTTIELSRRHEIIPDPKPHEIDGTRDSNNSPIHNPSSMNPKASPVSNNRTSFEKLKAPVRNMAERRIRDKSSFNNWDRIKRYDVLIPKDQQELLDGSDSWVPPETGQRLPRGRVPLSLLQEWDGLSCRPNVEDSLPDSLPDLLPVVGTRASSCGSEHGGQRTPTTSILPESSLPLSEWSLSPDQTANNAVPLDSSPPRSIHRAPQHTARTLELNKSPLATTLLGSTAAGSMLEDSAEDFSIEPSAFKGLDTSTQAQQIGAHAQQQTILQAQPSINVPNLDVPIDSQDPPPVGKSTSSKNHDGIARAPSKSITMPSDILVPATHAASHSKRATKFFAPCEQEPSHTSDHSPTELSPSHHSSSFGNADTVEPQSLRDKYNLTSFNEDDELGTVNVPCSSLNAGEEVTRSSPVSPLKPTVIARKRKAGQLGSGYIRPSKLQKTTVLNSPGVSNAVIRRRQDFFDELPGLPRTQEIFNKFRQAYPSYEGDMWIFSNSCNNLQSLREQGLMQQPFLWDDFVAREVGEYREYAMACYGEENTPDQYNHYFERKVTSSRFKKRNLTAKNIKLIATEFISLLKSSQSQASCTLSVDKPPPPAFTQPILDDDQSEYEFYDARETASEIPGNDDDLPISRGLPREMAERRGTNSGEPTAQLPTHRQSGIRSQDTSDLMAENKNRIKNRPTERTKRKSHQKQRQPIYPPSKGLNQRTSSPPPEISQSSPSPWWKDSTTSFKSFSKGYVNLLSELGRERVNPSHQPVPVDNDGVIEVEPQSVEQGGKMDSMGFEYPWT